MSRSKRVARSIQLRVRWASDPEGLRRTMREENYPNDIVSIYADWKEDAERDSKFRPLFTAFLKAHRRYQQLMQQYHDEHNRRFGGSGDDGPLYDPQGDLEPGEEYGYVVMRRLETQLREAQKERVRAYLAAKAYLGEEDKLIRSHYPTESAVPHPGGWEWENAEDLDTSHKESRTRLSLSEALRSIFESVLSDFHIEALNQLAYPRRGPMSIAVIQRRMENHRRQRQGLPPLPGHEEIIPSTQNSDLSVAAQQLLRWWGTFEQATLNDPASLQNPPTLPDLQKHFNNARSQWEPLVRALREAYQQSEQEKK